MAARTVTVKPSGGDYTSLSAAVATEGHDLTTDNGSGSPGPLIFEIGGSWSGAPDTTVVDFDGYTTDATNYIKVTTDSANKAGTSWSTTKYIYRISDANAFLVREDYIWIDGIQVQIHSQTGGRVFFQNVARSSGWIRLSNCIFRGDGGAQNLKFSSFTTGLFTPLVMWNCICYDWGSNSDSYFVNDTSGQTWTCRNCTFIWPSTTTVGCRLDGGTALIMDNCYSGGNTAGRDYFGSPTLTTCASSDTTGDVDNIAINTTNFTNVTGGSEDFALPLGSGLIGVGTDDPGSGLYSDDINGETRTSTWDIGADEYVAAGPSGMNQVQQALWWDR